MTGNDVCCIKKVYKVIALARIHDISYRSISHRRLFFTQLIQRVARKEVKNLYKIAV